MSVINVKNIKWNELLLKGWVQICAPSGGKEEEALYPNHNSYFSSNIYSDTYVFDKGNDYSNDKGRIHIVYSLVLTVVTTIALQLVLS